MVWVSDEIPAVGPQILTSPNPNTFVVEFLSVYGKALVFAVMPEDDGAGVEEAAAFLTHVQTTYPDTANHWQLLDSERDFVDIVTADEYQAAGADAAFSFGIVFSSGSPDWEYTVSRS